MGLTNKQEAFVQAFVRCGNQRQAFIEAYPKAAMWKPSIVDSQASRTMKKPKVYARYCEINHKVVQSAEEKTIVTTDRLLQQLAEIGFADMRDLYDDNGVPLPPNRLPDRIARCITSIDTTVDDKGNKYYKYRLNPKDKSLALMAQILGMLQPKPNDEGLDTNISITPVYGSDESG